MQNSKITFKEENISIDDAKKILDVFYKSTDENYKKGLEEITPFRDFYPKHNWRGWRDYCFYNIQIFLRMRRDMFRYKGVAHLIEQPEQDRVFVVGSINGQNKIFLKLKKGKKLLIDKMISIERGLGRQALKDLCEHYNTFTLVVKPSIYGRGFWEKMKKEYRNTITITIQ